MLITQTGSGEYTIIAPSGRITGEAADELQATGREAAASGAGTILIDLQDVEYIGSTGLKSLYNLHQHCQEQGLVMEVCAPPGPSGVLMRATCFDMLVPIRQSVEEAMSRTAAPAGAGPA